MKLINNELQDLFEAETNNDVNNDLSDSIKMNLAWWDEKAPFAKHNSNFI